MHRRPSRGDGCGSRVGGLPRHLRARGGLDCRSSDSTPAEPAPPFVTETMAELYLQQGFKDEALDVYRQLSAAYPDDEKLKDRIRKLERGDRASVSIDIVPDEVPLAADGAVPLGGMLDFDQTPVAAHEVVTEPAPDAAASGRWQHSDRRRAAISPHSPPVAPCRASSAAHGAARLRPRPSAPAFLRRRSLAAPISLPRMSPRSTKLFSGGAVLRAMNASHSRSRRSRARPRWAGRGEGKADGARRHRTFPRLCFSRMPTPGAWRRRAPSRASRRRCG